MHAYKPSIYVRIVHPFIEELLRDLGLKSRKQLLVACRLAAIINN